VAVAGEARLTVRAKENDARNNEPVPIKYLWPSGIDPPASLRTAAHGGLPRCHGRRRTALPRARAAGASRLGRRQCPRRSAREPTRPTPLLVADVARTAEVRPLVVAAPPSSRTHDRGISVSGSAWMTFTADAIGGATDRSGPLSIVAVPILSSSAEHRTTVGQLLIGYRSESEHIIGGERCFAHSCSCAQRTKLGQEQYPSDPHS